MTTVDTQPTADYHGTFKPTLNEDKNQTVAATGLGSLASPKPNPAPDKKDYYGTFEPKTNAPLDKRARTVTEAGQRLHGKAKDTQSRVKSAAEGRAGLQRQAAATAELTFAPKTNTPPPNKRDRQAITQAGHRLHSKAVDAQSRGPSRRAQIEAQRAAEHAEKEAALTFRVRVQIIRHARSHSLCKYQSCMV